MWPPIVPLTDHNAAVVRPPNAPMPPLGRVTPPMWDDKPLAIVGTGPSLKGFDFNRLDLPHIRVLAIKEAVWDLPFADCVFGLDRPWINRQAERLSALTMEKVFAVEPEFRPCAIVDGATYVLRTRYEGFSDDPTQIQSGGNSGFGGVNLAYLRRAKRIALFGFDYRDGHYCEDRYHWYAPGQNARYWTNWGDNFTGCRDQLALTGIEIINASPVSTVKAFQKSTIDEGIAWLLR